MKKKEYDLSRLRLPPAAVELKKSASMRLSGGAVDYFAKMAEGIGIPTRV
jgi:hypothetical protein